MRFLLVADQQGTVADQQGIVAHQQGTGDYRFAFTSSLGSKHITNITIADTSKR
jgi:hypothetical protein